MDDFGKHSANNADGEAPNLPQDAQLRQPAGEAPEQATSAPGGNVVPLGRRPGRPPGLGKPANSGRKPGSRNRITATVKAMATPYARRAFRQLVKLATTSSDEKVVLAASREILDRAYGRPVSPQELTGADGGPIVSESRPATDEQLKRLGELLGRREQIAPPPVGVPSMHCPPLPQFYETPNSPAPAPKIKIALGPENLKVGGILDYGDGLQLENSGTARPTSRDNVFVLRRDGALLLQGSADVCMKQVRKLVGDELPEPVLVPPQAAHYFPDMAENFSAAPEPRVNHRRPR